VEIVYCPLHLGSNSQLILLMSNEPTAKWTWLSLQIILRIIINENTQAIRNDTFT
jgi:hypothetical protein